jgi:hypothetical protein
MKNQEKQLRGGSQREALIQRRGATKWPSATILVALITLCLVLAQGNQAEKINAAAMNGLADSNLVVKNKQVFLYGIHTNGEDTKKGKYGCAKVVSVTLRKAGVKIPITLGVSGIETELKGWERIGEEDSLLPGDVVVWVSRFKGNSNGACTGGGTCHVGILCKKGFFHNNPLGYRPIFNGLGLQFGYKFKYGFRPPNKIDE